MFKKKQKVMRLQESGSLELAQTLEELISQGYRIEQVVEITAVFEGYEGVDSTVSFVIVYK